MREAFVEGKHGGKSNNSRKALGNWKEGKAGAQNTTHGENEGESMLKLKWTGESSASSPFYGSE
jgi:hypothetical protein